MMKQSWDSAHYVFNTSPWPTAAKAFRKNVSVEIAGDNSIKKKAKGIAHCAINLSS